jgi:F-type H+-transporting ATPase subunit gamma
MAQTKEISRRLKSIRNTQKITKAMEMVAAAKMRKSTEAVLKTRTYANLSWMTVLNIANSSNANKYLHPLLSKRDKIKKVAVILISSNRGLCGGFNSAILHKAMDSVKKHGNLPTDFIVVGKKGLSIYSRYKYPVIAEFDKNDSSVSMSEIRPLVKIVLDGFLKNEYDKVLVAYTDYVNVVKQVPRIKQILPVEIDEEDDYLGIVGQDERVGLTKEYIAKKEDKYLSRDGAPYIFKYEPDEEEVLNQIIPRLLEVQLLQAILESNASEHSARMTAMNQANQAAADLSDELQLLYNKARQAGITAEIAEISAGANALAK